MPRFAIKAIERLRHDLQTPELFLQIDLHVGLLSTYAYIIIQIALILYWRNHLLHKRRTTHGMI